ncbi:MAG: 4-(cytidine 5'-diphospho)-2-C-methyl-D-erythritol kinase [Anaerorhabdus sp.]
MKDRAFAKINLCLNVVGKRDDGYHELEMIMVPINFYDVVDIKISKEMQFSSNATYLPKTDKNTVIKAIEVLREEYGFSENFDIQVVKHIPTQAGLAGGSADAAAAIRILKKMLNLDMSHQKMVDLAKKVGADVPFCCFNKPAYVSGIGEKMELFEMKSSWEVLLVKPYRGVSTPKAFNLLDLANAAHPDCLKMKESLENEDDRAVLDNLGNTLEQPAIKLLPVINEIKVKLLELGMSGVLMSGSGSTVFALTKDKKKMRYAAKKMKENGFFVRETNIYQSSF